MKATAATDPAIRTDVIVTIGRDDARSLAPRSDPDPPPRTAAAGAPTPAPRYSIGVSQCAYSGRRPRTASK